MVYKNKKDILESFKAFGVFVLVEFLDRCRMSILTNTDVRMYKNSYFI